MAPRLRAVFDAAPANTRAGMLYLRGRILAVAQHEGATVEESLKWGQPSYRAPKGSPLRIGSPKSGGFALFAHCATSLISDYALIAPMARLDGTRAVLFRGMDEVNAQPLDHLIRAALVYHANR